MRNFSVAPAKAGVPLPSRQESGIPDCVGMAIWSLVVAFLLLLSGPSFAQSYPKLTGRVVDQAGLLSPAQVVDLTSKSEALEARTGRQFVVATVNSLEGREIEEYATGLFRQWGIGDKERDDGVLLLVAPNERKVRIENGYGAEAFMTDIVSGRIIRDTILPRFKAGDLAGGIAAGADQIIAMMQLPPEEAARRAQEIGASESRRQRIEINPVPIIFMVILFFFVIGSIARAAGGRRYYRGGKRRRRGGLDTGDMAVILWGLDALSRGSRGGGGWGGGGGSWGGGGGSFGGFSGGGGWSGGGGASGSW